MHYRRNQDMAVVVVPSGKRDNGGKEDVIVGGWIIILR